MGSKRIVKNTNNNVNGWTKHPTRVIGIAIQREAPKSGTRVVRSEALWKRTNTTNQARSA